MAPRACSNCELSFPGAAAGEGWGEGRSRRCGCVPAPGACGNRRCWKCGGGGCARELLLAGKSFSPREEPGQQVTPKPPSPPVALSHLDHSPLAVVPYPLWEEDSCLRGHLGEWVPSSAEVHVRLGFPAWGEQSCVPLREPGAGQWLLLMMIWCLFLILLIVLSWMWPRPAETAAVGLWEEGCAAASSAVPAIGGLAWTGGKNHRITEWKGKGQGVWVRRCLHSLVSVPYPVCHPLPHHGGCPGQ